MASLFEILAKISLDGSGFDVGMKRVQSVATKAALSMKKEFAKTFAGLFTVAAILKLTKNTTELAGQVADLSQKLGISTDNIQAFSHAAKLSGASIDDVANAMKELAKSQVAALGGSGSELDAFKQLGVSLDDLRNKNPEQLFLQVAKAMEGTSASSMQTASALKVMGNAGDKLMAGLRGGFAGAAEEAKAFGVVMDEMIIAKLDNAGDKFDTFATKIKVVFGSVLAFLADRLTDLQSTIAYISAFFGNLGKNLKPGEMANPFSAEGRADFRQALEKAREAGMAVYEAEAAALSKTAPQSTTPELSERFSVPVDKRQKLGGLGGLTSASSLNSLQQIGALSIQGPNRQIQHLSRIEAYTKQVAKNTDKFKDIRADISRGDFGGNVGY